MTVGLTLKQSLTGSMRSLDGRRSSVLVLTALAILAFLTYFYVSPPGNQERVTNENVDYLYRDVTRSKDGVLYMAFYFPQYHIAPENKVELEVEHYTDWDVLKKNSNAAPKRHVVQPWC